ncbi:MAG: hypothetical protein H8E53_00875, partial [Planctomycetes bacterium]|nr:hypothetical protein [Planctomycetota bacterium]
MEPRSIPLAYLLLAVLVTAAPQHTWGADSRPDILPIVSRAAGDDEAATEKALDELADMGATGMARLRAIEADTTRYTEKQRRQATLAYNRLTDMMAPEKRDSYRAAGEVAFTAANYDLMARKYARIAVLADANVEDCLWNGHARQLAGRWKSAAEAYRLALARVEEMIDNPPDPRAPNPLGGGGKRRLSGRNTSNMRALLTQHAALALLIGKILRYECSDPAGAAGVFASAFTRSPDINRPLDKLLADCVTHVEPSRTDQKRPIDFSLEYIMQCLRQVPACMEQSGRSHEAFAAWTRACAVGMLRDRQPGLESVSAMARLLARIKTPQPGRGRGPGEELQPMPRTPWLIMLTPDSPATTLKLDDPATRARSYHHGSLDTPHWKFAICPPPGKEFATVTFACDIEQLNVRYGGQFACAALVGDLGERLVHVGDISWKNKTAGREMIKRTFNMPASTRMLSVTTGSRKDYFKVWELKINATFRPAGKPGAGAKPTARIR